MRLTKLVPALALVAAVAAPSAAVELADGALTIKGDIEFKSITPLKTTAPTMSPNPFSSDFDMYFVYASATPFEGTHRTRRKPMVASA